MFIYSGRSFFFVLSDLFNNFIRACSRPGSARPGRPAGRVRQGARLEGLQLQGRRSRPGRKACALNGFSCSESESRGKFRRRRHGRAVLSFCPGQEAGGRIRCFQVNRQKYNGSSWFWGERRMSERRPEVLLHEPLWKIPSQTPASVETGFADFEDSHGHHTACSFWFK